MVQKYFMDQIQIILKMFINYLKLLKFQKKINTPKQLASSIIFKKNKNIQGNKIKKYWRKNLKKNYKRIR